jgi:isopentenyl phosphate kinase
MGFLSTTILPNRIILVHGGGGIWFGHIADASKETLHFGCWSSAHTKLGALAVQDYINKIFRLDSVCASAVDTPTNVL